MTFEVKANKDQVIVIRKALGSVEISNKMERFDPLTVNFEVHEDDADVLTDILDSHKIEWRLV